MEDDEPPRKLRAGDIVIVASQRNHHLKGEGLSDGTERTRIASGRLSSQELGSDAIYSFLPPVLVTNLFSDAAKEDLAEAVRIGGAFDENAGARVILSRLTELLILMTAHRSVENLPEKVHGWVGALLSDPKIGKALRLIHSDPATDWTVDRLAREVAMSRTAFSQQFSTRVGQAPMAYVTRWRMQVAIDLLRADTASMANIAEATGYATESAFCKAFRREIGVPPAAYGKAMGEARRDMEKLKAARLKEVGAAVTRDGPRTELEKIALELERLAPLALCSILLFNAAEKKLHFGAAPSLPDAYNKTIDGISVGPCAGSCGTAVHRGQPVITRDILSSELWADYRYLAERYNLKSCWSSPIFGDGGRVLGTFAVYYTDFHEPNGAELGLIDHMSAKVKAVLEARLPAGV
jgi:AraC-like DNA-binding protein